jgi:hypothetical protein
VRIDVLTIVGINGIEAPDDTSVDSEFVITARVRVCKLEREEVDVSSYGSEPETMPGALRVDLVFIGQPKITP